MPVVINDFEALPAADPGQIGGAKKPQSAVAANAAASLRLRQLARRRARIAG